MNREDLIQEIVESLARCQRTPGPSAWKSVGLSHAQIGMLFMLFHHQQGSVKQISEYLGITKSAVTQLLDPLVDKQLVTRENDPKDRRVVRLSLTPKGFSLLKKLNRLKFAGIRSALDNLNSAELSQMAALHQKMITGIQRQTRETK
jgi:DNA-binding MarR family transcriptional regulator